MKSYIILPLAALLAFGAVYWNFERKHEARAAEAREQARAGRENKLKADAVAREKGIEQALQLQARRKQEREERDAREKLQKETLQAAIDTRDKIHRDVEKNARQLDRLKKEIATETKAVEESEAAYKAVIAEQDFLKNHIAQTTDNLRELENLLALRNPPQRL